MGCLPAWLDIWLAGWLPIDGWLAAAIFSLAADCLVGWLAGSLADAIRLLAVRISTHASGRKSAASISISFESASYFSIKEKARPILSMFFFASSSSQK